MTTASLGRFQVARRAFEVLEGGTQTTVQDWPGRLGFWHVGVPPSGPMDSLALRLANRLVGNGGDAPALEMTGIGAKLRFDADAVVAICGADMDARLEDAAVELWKAIEIKAGQILKFSAVKGAGTRTYLAVLGGIVSPKFLGSASTFMLGQIWRPCRQSIAGWGCHSFWRCRTWQVEAVWLGTARRFRSTTVIGR